MATDGWGPVPSHKPLSDVLPAECTSAFYVRAADGAYRIFAVCQLRVYELDRSGGAWNEVSR